MGVNYYVLGVMKDKRADDLLKVYNQCVLLGIEPPDEANALFGDNRAYVDGLGMTVRIEALEGSDPDNLLDWLLVDLDAVPDGVDALAFVASY